MPRPATKLGQLAPDLAQAVHKPSVAKDGDKWPPGGTVENR
jgi:hypothetical protein